MKAAAGCSGWPAEMRGGSEGVLRTSAPRCEGGEARRSCGAVWRPDPPDAFPRSSTGTKKNPQWLNTGRLLRELRRATEFCAVREQAGPSKRTLGF